MDRAPARAGADAGRFAYCQRPGRVRNRTMRHVSHSRIDASSGNGRSRFDSRRQPYDVRRRYTAEHTGESRRLDRRSSDYQTRREDAGEFLGAKRSAGAPRLSGHLEMTAQPLPDEFVPATPIDEVLLPPAIDEADRARLHATWEPVNGLVGWLKSVGKRYICAALVFFLLGGLEAAAMRMQLSRPENTLIGPDLYNQIFTMHGTTMMFLFAVPIMTAIGIYLVPLMIGTRNVAFPRLNALGFWVYLLGGIFLYSFFFSNTGPDAGWFAYVPLSGPQYGMGKRVDVYAQMVTFTEIAALIAALEAVVTICKMRAPGMTWGRLPLFVWSQLVTAVMVMFAMSSVATASIMLGADRLIATQFFNPAEGGDVLLWQHLFWFFGHPEVYIIFIPALGMVSQIVTTFTRRP